MHRVEVSPLPPWLDAGRWLGEGTWTRGEAQGPGGTSQLARAELETAAAADLAARLRGLWLAGEPVVMTCSPPLKRAAVRAARTADARRRRDTTPGFDDARARADGLARVYLTPQALAMQMAQRAALEFPGGRVVDAMCGAGGNALAFARAGLEVIAVDTDADRLELARRNAAVYAVADRCRFVQGDGAAALAAERYDLAFLDPPWTVDIDQPVRDPGPEQLGPLRCMLDAAGDRRTWLKLPPGTRLEGVLAPSTDDEIEAVFGVAPGDRRRIKFLWLRRGGPTRGRPVCP